MPLSNLKKLQELIKKRCIDSLNIKDEKSVFILEMIIQHDSILESAKWTSFDQDMQTPNFDQGTLEAQIEWLEKDIAEKFQAEQNSQTTRTSPERVIKEYYLANIYSSREKSQEALQIVTKKLQSDSDNVELKQYQAALSSNITYLDSLAVLPMAAEKMVETIQKDLGKNFSPRQNAQVITALLDTMQKVLSTNHAHWSAETLLKAVKFIAKVVKPDLPVDEITLKTVKELLPYVNDMLDKTKNLEEHTTKIFPEKDKNQTNARKALLASMGVKFESFSAICQNTLVKPIQDTIQGGSSLLTQAGELSTEEGLDYLRTMGFVDNLANSLYQAPQEVMPDFIKAPLGYYQTARNTVGQMGSVVGQVASGTGQVLSGLGSMVYQYTPEVVKNVADKALDITAAATQRVGPMIAKMAAIAVYVTPNGTTIPYIPLLNKQTALSIKDKLVNAVSSITPNFVKEKFNPQVETTFWSSLKPQSITEKERAEIYLEFYKVAGASKSPTMEEDFFNSYMSNQRKDIKLDYTDYKVFKKQMDLPIMSQPLVNHFSSFEKEQDRENRLSGMVNMVLRLKQFEDQATDLKAVPSILHDLKSAMEYESEDPKIADFKNIYLKPMLQKTLLAYEQNHLNSTLEKTLDSEPGNEQLRSIYSKLKSGQILSNPEIGHLKTQPAKFPAEVLKTMEEINQVLPALPAQETPRALTPKEEARESVQTTLNSLSPVAKYILEGFEAQRASCEALRELCPNDPLKSLCEAKIRYLDALLQTTSRLVEDMQPGGKLAEQIRHMTTAEGAKELVKVPDGTTMAKQLMSGAWEIMLPKGGMVDATLAQQVMGYALSNNNYMQGIVEAKHQYDKTFKATPPPPELISRDQLGSPVQATISEDLVEKGSKYIVDMGVDSVVTPMASFYLASTALSFVFPQALVAEVAVGVLMRPSMQKRIADFFPSMTNLFKSVTDKVSGMLDAPKQYLTESVKEYICPMLNIEVQKVLERKALDYVSADPAMRSKMNKSERDSFSGFYLQYRAFKKGNPDLDKEACIKYIFKGYLSDKNLGEQKEFIDKFSAEFTKLDNALMLKDQPIGATADLEKELQFLISHIDFNSPSETALVGMTIYNRLATMQFGAAQQVTEEQAGQLQQKAMTAIQTFLASMEKADAKTEFVSEHARAAAMAPVTELAAKTKWQELQKLVDSSLTSVDASIRDRELQVKTAVSNTEPERLGKSVLAADIAKTSKPGLLFRVGSAIARVAPAVTVIGSIVAAVVSKGAITGALTALGIAGATAGTIATGGIAGFAAIAALRVAYTTAKEVRARSEEFSAIDKSNSSPLKKVGLKFLTGLKCFGVGLAKAILLDTVYEKIKGVFEGTVKLVINEAQNIRELARVHPSREILDSEKTSLQDLHKKLKELKTLVDEQVRDKQALGYVINPEASKFHQQSSYDKSMALVQSIDERAEKIEKLHQQISTAVSEAQTVLEAPASNDARWANGTNAELERFKTSFTKLNHLMDDVNLITRAEIKMRPDINVHEKAATHHAKFVQENRDLALNAMEKIRGKEGFIFNNLREKSSVAEMQQIASDIRTTLSSIEKAVMEADKHLQLTNQAANQAGEIAIGALGSIEGPATVAQNQARRAASDIKDAHRAVKIFLQSVENEITKQMIKEAQSHKDQEQIPQKEAQRLDGDNEIDEFFDFESETAQFKAKASQLKQDVEDEGEPEAFYDASDVPSTHYKETLANVKSVSKPDPMIKSKDEEEDERDKERPH